MSIVSIASNVGLLTRFAEIAPLFIAELPMVPVKVITTKSCVEIAPPLYAVLVMKSLIPMNFNKVLVSA